MRIVQYKMNSKVGPIYLVASSSGLKSIYFQPQQIPMIESLESADPQTEILKNAVNQLSEYFDGRRATFDLPTDVAGTDFQKKVWSELNNIPFGSTVSYMDIAKRLNNTGAVRAVGAANGKNPLSIIVPCHRVVGANGSLTGYSGGIEIKKKLLEFEKTNVI